MAASFIVGIAAGSKIGVRLARTGPHHVMWLSVLLIVAAAGTLIAGWFTALQLPLIVARYVNAGTSFGPLLFREATIVGLALMASSAAFGAVFTLSLALAAPTTESAARDASRVYAANTIGAVLGALAGGFVLVPRFGLESTFLHVSRALIAAGAIVSGVDAVRAATHRKPAVIVAAIAACVYLQARLRFPNGIGRCSLAACTNTREGSSQRTSTSCFARAVSTITRKGLPAP